MTEVPPITTAPPPAPALIYRNRPSLPGLVLKNLGLNVVTLWFYRFWAKTRWRRHIWSNVTLLGDPIEYTGTGQEMFKGFLVALAFVAPFLIVFGAWEAMVAEGGAGYWIERIAYFAVLYLLIVSASFYARRYRLSRTRWRGVALVLDAKFGDYLKFHLRTQALNALTLFSTTPRASMAIEGWLISRTRLGAVHFQCAPDWRPLINLWIAFLFCGALNFAFGWQWLAQILKDEISTLGIPGIDETRVAGVFVLLVICYVIYRVAFFRTILNGTALNGAVFASEAKAKPILVDIGLGGASFVAAMVVTVGSTVLLVRNDAEALIIPVWIVAVIVSVALIRDAWIAPRIIDHLVSSVTISNAEALAAIAGGMEDSMSRGEGLADSFDVGIG